MSTSTVRLAVVSVVSLWSNRYCCHFPDCSKFWECGPSGPCLFQCGECEFCGPNNRLSFDCRWAGVHLAPWTKPLALSPIPWSSSQLVDNDQVPVPCGPCVWLAQQCELHQWQSLHWRLLQWSWLSGKTSHSLWAAKHYILSREESVLMDLVCWPVLGHLGPVQLQ